MHVHALTAMTRVRNLQRGQALLVLIACSGLTACYNGATVGPGLGDEDGGTGGATKADSLDGGDESGDPTDGDTGDPPTGGLDCNIEANWAAGFLDTTCGGCHGANGSGAGDFDYIDDVGRLLLEGRIVPGDPEGSSLYVRIANGSMPPPEVNQRPDEEQINRFADYIELCAEAPVGQCQEENVVVPINDQLQAMQTDLTQLDNNDRPFTRYLTLTHLHNAGYCGEEVDVFRFGMAKLVNSLSFEVTIRPPVPIDDLETIYRIDIRDYGWDEPINGLSDRWELIADQSPYSFERLESQADTLKLFSETDVPFMAADAFIEIASQPPLYYDLTNIPSTRGQLEARLGLNIDVNIEDEEVIRAGFLDSAVSRQNRIIERHELPFGAGQALWISYDFTDDGLQDQNIFASPLDFQETQAEILFSLPNGLHGYMLVDGNGNRIDEGNDQIVSDPGQPDLNVRSGISCFGCHEEIVVAEDQLRAHVLDGLEFDSQTKEVVEALYPDAVAFAEVQAADTERYLAALAQLGLTPDSSPTREPISDSFSRFSLSVDINRAAAELGISTDALFSNIGRLDPVLAPLNGASVKRDTWTAKFPNTVCLLNLGVADDPACDGVGGGDDGDDGGVEDDGGGETGAGETGGESGGVDCAVLDEAICGFFDECVFNEDAQLCEPA